MQSARNVAVLGSTGSIGVNTLDVIRLHPGRFSVYALSANVNVDLLFAQCVEFTPRYAAMANESSAAKLKFRLEQAGSKTRILHGEPSISRLASDDAVEVVVAGIVGAIAYAGSCARREIHPGR
jgi:1-deoxy-D-xylulose-5-phosphate reductoisomerase